MQTRKPPTGIRRYTSAITQTKRLAESIAIELEATRLNQGVILSRLNEQLRSTDLRDYEFKVFSQWGDDGIIQHLIKSVDIRNRTFIEFGVENFLESNCRFLLMKDNWRGFVIDGSEQNIQDIRNSHYYWKHDLSAISAFITKDNINELLARSGFEEDIGILSIDLDGNDYHILQAINTFRPRILICEYNAAFGPQRKISVPYDTGFVRTAKHHSNLYFGASLPAMAHLAASTGYALVGANSAGANAFFVRNELLNDRVVARSVEQSYVDSRFRESRDRQGCLTHLSGDSRLKEISGLPVYNVETGAIESL